MRMHLRFQTRVIIIPLILVLIWDTQFTRRIKVRIPVLPAVIHLILLTPDLHRGERILDILLIHPWTVCRYLVKPTILRKVILIIPNKILGFIPLVILSRIITLNSIQGTRIIQRLIKIGDTIITILLIVGKTVVPFLPRRFHWLLLALRWWLSIYRNLIILRGSIFTVVSIRFWRRFIFFFFFLFDAIFIFFLLRVSLRGSRGFFSYDFFLFSGNSESPWVKWESFKWNWANEFSLDKTLWIEPQFPTEFSTLGYKV